MEIDKQALQQLISANEIRTTEDLQSLLREWTREMIDTVYEGELTAQLGYKRHSQAVTKGGNYRNGHGQKTVKGWRPAIFVIIFTSRFIGMDGIVVKLRQIGIVRNVTVYLVIGMDMNGRTSCMGLYAGESESAKYWLTVMNELKNRGVEDILIIAVDNLVGISDAIETAFPKAEIQKCIVHQVRNSLKFVPCSKGTPTEERTQGSRR